MTPPRLDYELYNSEILPYYEEHLPLFFYTYSLRPTYTAV